jgi:hypothetical protein
MRKYIPAGSSEDANIEPGIHTVMAIRSHKLDSLFIISTFSIFHAGGRSLFIIHCSFSPNLHATPLVKGVWLDDHRVMLRLKVTR